jgi:hypothetical protein
MFFTISKTPCNILSEQHRIGEWVFSTDRGWTTHRSSSGIRLEKGLGDVNCVLTSDGRDWQITTKALRRFPLWRSDSGDTVSNLLVTDNQIHNPHTVGYSDGQLRTQFGHNPLINDQPMDRNTAEEQLCDDLVRQVDDLKAHDMPIIAPNSRGADCALVRAVLDYSGVEYTSHKVSDQTLDLTRLSGQQPFRLYRQLLDDGSPHIQATGFNGDAYMSRLPTYVALYLKKWNIDLTAEFDKAGATYMRNSFDRNYRDKISTYVLPEDPHLTLVDMLVNDFQVWHIDECLTWTPLTDTKIMETCLRIDPETAIDQCLNAGLTRSLIKRLSPTRLNEIQQNHNGNGPV